MTTADLPLAMPLKPANHPDVPTWSPRKFTEAIEVARLRTKEGKTQIVMRLATAATTSPQTIYAWRKGEGTPGINEAFALARELDVEVEDLAE